MKLSHPCITWRSWCLGSCSTLSFWSCVGGRCRRRRWRADMPPAPETWWWSGSCLSWGGVSARGGTEVQVRKVKIFVLSICQTRHWRMLQKCTNLKPLIASWISNHNHNQRPSLLTRDPYSQQGYGLINEQCICVSNSAMTMGRACCIRTIDKQEKWHCLATSCTAKMFELPM